MGTSNFHSVNASKIFAIETEGMEQFEYNDLKENLEERVAEIAEKLSGIVYYPGGKDEHELRSYPSHILGRLSASKTFSQKQFSDSYELGVELTAIIRSGYSSGVNLDWQVQYLFDGNGMGLSVPSVTEIAENISYYTGIPEEKAGQKAITALKWYERQAAKMVRALEAKYKKMAQPLKVWATFSNGETMYEKA